MSYTYCVFFLVFKYVVTACSPKDTPTFTSALCIHIPKISFCFCGCLCTIVSVSSCLSIYIPRMYFYYVCICHTFHTHDLWMQQTFTVLPYMASNNEYNYCTYYYYYFEVLKYGLTATEAILVYKTFRIRPQHIINYKLNINDMNSWFSKKSLTC